MSCFLQTPCLPARRIFWEKLWSVQSLRFGRLVANEPRFNSYWYLFPPGTVTEEAIIVQIVMNWFKFFILYSNLMPISLCLGYVCVCFNFQAGRF